MMRRQDASSPRSINPFLSRKFVSHSVAPYTPPFDDFFLSLAFIYSLLIIFHRSLNTMATSMYEGGYNDSNRAFLQAFMARSTMTFDEAKPVLAAIFSAQGAPFLSYPLILPGQS
jgi:hypothetical protein